MSFYERYPIFEQQLGRGESNRYNDQCGYSIRGIGVKFPDTVDNWLDIKSDQSGAYITVENDRSVLYQRFVEVGDSINFGKDDYNFGDYVSRKHISISPVHVSINGIVRNRVRVIDTSLNGTQIWRHGQEDKISDQNAAMNQDNADEQMLTELDRLIERYGHQFQTLELTDFGILSTIIKSHPEELISRTDKMRVIRMIHPDRNLTGNPQRNHELYLLSKQVLGI